MFYISCDFQGIVSALVCNICITLGLGGCNNKGMKMKEVTYMKEQSRGKKQHNVIQLTFICLLDVLKGRAELMKFAVNMVRCDASCVLVHHYTHILLHL